MVAVNIKIDVSGEVPGIPGEARVFTYPKVSPTPPLVTLSLGDSTGVTSYFWEIVDQPEGGTAVLSNHIDASPTFTPNADLAGTYLISCSVNGGEITNTNGIAFTTENKALRLPAASETKEFGLKGWKDAANKWGTTLDSVISGDSVTLDGAYRNGRTILADTGSVIVDIPAGATTPSALLLQTNDTGSPIGLQIHDVVNTAGRHLNIIGKSDGEVSTPHLDISSNHGDNEYIYELLASISDINYPHKVTFDVIAKTLGTGTSALNLQSYGGTSGEAQINIQAYADPASLEFSSIALNTYGPDSKILIGNESENALIHVGSENPGDITNAIFNGDTVLISSLVGALELSAIADSIYFSDSYKVGSSYPGEFHLSDSSSDWTEFYSKFGETSLIEALLINYEVAVKWSGGSIDNAIARFDGTSGDLIQGSLASISDTGQIIIPEGSLALPSIVLDDGGTPNSFGLFLGNDAEDRTLAFVLNGTESFAISSSGALLLRTISSIYKTSGNLVVGTNGSSVFSFGATNTSYSNIKLNNSAPQIYLEEDGIAPDAGGLWRFVLNNGDFSIQENTSAGGDFSGLRQWLIFDKSETELKFSCDPVPVTTNTYDLGGSALRWKDIWADGRLITGDGTEGNPSITFGSATTTGIYLYASNAVRLVAEGVARFQVSGSVYSFADLNVETTTPEVRFRDTTIIEEDSGKRWRFLVTGEKFYLQNNTAVSGDWSTQRNWFLFSPASNTIQCNATFRPDATNAYDLGTETYKWRDLYLSGSVKVSNGAIATPSFTFGSATSTGMYLRKETVVVPPGGAEGPTGGTYDYNYIGFSVDGTELFRIDNTFPTVRTIRLINDIKRIQTYDDLLILTAGSSSLTLEATSDLKFRDDYKSDSSNPGALLFSSAISEWTEFYSNFGSSTSLVNAINQAATPKKSVFIPIEWAKGGTTPPTAPTTYISGTGFVVASPFSGSTTQDTTFMWIVPENLDTSKDISVKVHGIITETTVPTSGQGISFKLSGYSVGIGDPISGTFGSEVASDQSDLFAVGCASQYDAFITVESANIPITNVANDEKVFLRIKRDTASAVDDYEQNVGVMGVTIHYYEKVV